MKFPILHLIAFVLAAASSLLGQEPFFEDLPDDFEVHSIGINLGPKVTDVVLDNTRRLATQATVVVNKPDTPVVLVLSGAAANVWEVGRTEGTHIAAVIVTGTRPQALIGINASVPYAISTHFKKGDFSDFVLDNNRERLLEAEGFIEEMVGRGTTLLQLYPESEVYHVGEPADPADILYSDFLKIEDYLDPSHPPGKKPAEILIEKLLDEGKIRPTTEEDVQDWFDAASAPYAKFNNPDLRVDFSIVPLLDVDTFPSHFILEEFEFEANEYEVIKATFLVPEEVSLPETFLDEALWIYRMDGTETGLLYRIENGLTDKGVLIDLDPDANKPADDSSLEPFFEGIPEDYRLYAVDTYHTPFRRPELRIDDEGGRVTQADVIVNEPDGTPVVLALTSHDSIVWSVGLTEGTNLAGVIVSGRAGAALTGVPGTVPYVNSTYLVRGDFKPMMPERATPDLLEMNDRLKALGGRDIDHFYFHTYDASTGLFHVGQPLQENQTVLYSDDLSVDDYVLPNTPLYGKAGIDQLVREGKMRPATLADVNAWIALETEGLPDFAEDAGWRNVWVQEGTTYVILDQITFPSGMSGSGILAYIVPEGVPKPKGSPHFAQILSVEERIEATRERFATNFEAWAKDLEKRIGEGASVTTSSDADKDGVGDRIEFLTGSDPLDAASVHFLETSVSLIDAEAYVRLEVPLRTNDTGDGLVLETTIDGRVWKELLWDFALLDRKAVNPWTDRVRLQSVEPTHRDEPMRLFRLRSK